MNRSFVAIILILAVLIGIWFLGSSGTQMENNATSTSATSTETQDIQVYSSDDYQFTLMYPEEISVSESFTPSYLIQSNWNAYTQAESGSPVVAFTYPDSNEVLAAQLRIGVSNDVQEVANCKILPENVTTSESTTINGVNFTYFISSSAATMHFAEIDSYRTVYNDYCYALDLIISGTNPEVYDPPREVPFDKDRAHQTLMRIISSFKFNN